VEDVVFCRSCSIQSNDFLKTLELWKEAKKHSQIKSLEIIKDTSLSKGISMEGSFAT
jgi:hypothetical protein